MPENLITQHFDTWTQAIETKSSAGRGSSNKFTVVGIKKLRELILEMAVRGLLVPQDPNDEPASVLLEKIAAEKAQLIKDGKIKKTKALPEISEDEKPFDLPNGWGITHLDDISIINGGFAFKSSEYVDVGIRVIRISDFDEKGFKDNNIVRYTYSPELEQYNIAQNNILMAMTGGTVGKSLLVMDLSEQMLTNQRVACIKIITGFIERYVHSVLMTSLAQDVIEDAKNSTNDNISMTNIKSFIIPVPPLEEQKRIVAKVDDLMALCDQLESQTLDSIATHQTLVETLLGNLVTPPVIARPQAVAISQPAGQDASRSHVPRGNADLELAENNDMGSHAERGNQSDNQLHQAWPLIAQNFDVLFTTEHSIDTLKQTILQLAVMGKLVPQNPNDEPASKLLEKIAAEKAQLIKDKKIKKTKALPDLSEDEKPFELPSGWMWERLGNIGETNVGLTYKPSQIVESNGIPVLRSTNIQNNRIDLKELVRLDIDDIKESALINIGDLLICARNGSKRLVGKTAMLQEANEKMAFGAFMAVFRSRINPFVELFINSPIFRRELAGVNTTTINQITQSNLKLTVCSIPPLEEQKRIVAKVDELMALCDQLKTQLQAAQQSQTHLAQSIAKEALA